MDQNHPFAGLVVVPPLTVTSTSIADGRELPQAQYSGAFGIPGGLDLSPQLAWEGAPDGTKSFVVTVFDADAPTGSGFWHWAVANIPASVTSLPEGAGAAGFDLPGTSMCLPNEIRTRQFIGAAPPAGHGPHRYFFIVSALDVDHLDISEEATPGLLGFMMFGHVLARGAIVGIGQID